MSSWRLDRLPIRWRLALSSALLTLVILLGFAITVGTLTVDKLRSDLHSKVHAAAVDLQSRIELTVSRSGQLRYEGPDLNIFASSENSQIKIVTLDGTVLKATTGAPTLELPITRSGERSGYYIESLPLSVNPRGRVILQYAQSTYPLKRTITRIRLFLGLGILGGVLLALIAGLAVAQRAMRPVVELTAAAREIERTRNPSLELPQSRAGDEVAELGTTLSEMLRALDEARTHVEEALRRERQFIADASHELRTPLTGVLTNLELLADLKGDAGESAQGALRSARRMRTLVTDLLLLARTDAEHSTLLEPVDLAVVVREAVAELGSLSDDHELAVNGTPAVVRGVRDELYRVVINLISNALIHTPPQTKVTVTVGAEGVSAILVVSDTGPGVPFELRDRVFDRFVSGESDHGRSTGLGLAIVRAVVEEHDGSVELEQAEGGATFMVRLPLAAD